MSFTPSRPNWRAALFATALLSAAVVGALATANPAAVPTASTASTPQAVSVEMHAIAGDLPTAAGAAGTPAVAKTADGVLAVQVSTSAVTFGDLEPGETSAPIAVEVANIGQVPVTLSFSGTALAGPEGTSIPANRLSVSASTESRGGSLGAAGVSFDKAPVAPGAKLVLYVTLQVPSGDETYVPAGPYTGLITLTAKGVGA